MHGLGLEDYISMFDLSSRDLTLSFLDFYPGASSFNTEMHKMGKSVISCDTIYKENQSTLKRKIENDIDKFFVVLQQSQKKYNKNMINSMPFFQSHIDRNITSFLEDYEMGRKEKRYQPISLGQLPYENNQFDMVLCSHYLFDKRVSLTLPEQLDILNELSRIASEVRIFPLADSMGEQPKHLGDVLLNMQKENKQVEIKKVNFQLVKHENAMMRIWNTTCSL